MRVLVTGGAGFIGSHVVDALLAQRHEVAVLDNLSSGRRENVPSGVKLYEVDLRDRTGTARAILDFRPGAVSHQAAQASVAISVRDPHLDADVNVMGGLNLLDACTASGVAVERLVFASTGGAIYGEVADPGRANESTLPAPVSPYAIHKHAFEQLLSAYHRYRGLGFTVLRYANVYGPRQDPHGEAGVVAIFFDRVRAGHPLRVNARRHTGDDGCIRDYVFVGDVARANALALAGSLEERVLNVGSGNGTTTLELARAIFQSHGKDTRIEFAAPRVGDIERSVLDPTQVERYLGRLVTLSDGLHHTRDFCVSNQA